MDINPATCDLHRQHRGIRVWSVASQKKAEEEEKKKYCWATGAFRFVFMWFQPANPDQTVILIGEKHPSCTFKYLRFQLLSMTDRQRYVKQASCGITHSFTLYLWKLCRQINNASLSLFLVFHFFSLANFSYFWEFVLLPSDSQDFICLFLFWRKMQRLFVWVSFFKDTGEADTLPAPAALASGEFPVAPCQAAMSTVLFTYWMAPGIMLASSDNTWFIITHGPSGNLYANQGKFSGTGNHVAVIKGKEMCLLVGGNEVVEESWN